MELDNGSWSLLNTQQTGGSVVAGGLGDYGSDESADEGDRSVRGSESSDTDEEELRHRIREKQDAFRRKERESQQEKQAQEAQLALGEVTSVVTAAAEPDSFFHISLSASLHMDSVVIVFYRLLDSDTASTSCYGGNANEICLFLAFAMKCCSVSWESHKRCDDSGGLVNRTTV